MKRLGEIHVRRDLENGLPWGWMMEVFPPGEPRPDMPVMVEKRTWKSTVMAMAREEQRLRWAGGNGWPSELYEHNRKGEIIDRSTFPRSADPVRSLG